MFVSKVLQDIRCGMTRTVKIRKGNIGNKKGWCFTVFYNDREYPNIISALYKTRKETIEKAKDYIYTDKLDTYGSAE